MLKMKQVFLLIFINFVFCNKVLNKMEEHKVVPDVIDVVPDKTVKVGAFNIS